MSWRRRGRTEARMSPVEVPRRCRGRPLIFPPPVIERGSVEAPSAQEIERGQDVAPGDYLASVNFSTALGCGGPVTRVSADRRHAVTERDGGRRRQPSGRPAQHSVRRFPPTARPGGKTCMRAAKPTIGAVPGSDIAGPGLGAEPRKRCFECLTVEILVEQCVARREELPRQFAVAACGGETSERTDQVRSGGRCGKTLS